MDAPFTDVDTLRVCTEADVPTFLGIINAAAEAYRGVIPADRWHDPYMTEDELRAELAAGVAFMGLERDGILAGVMGMQQVKNVSLIRHAYVRPECQGRGIGAALLKCLITDPDRPILIGTWAAADWAIRFYERNGFSLVSEVVKAPLLMTYWRIPYRQVETSVVLASPALSEDQAVALIKAA